jgi:hypothetical protein
VLIHGPSSSRKPFYWPVLSSFSVVELPRLGDPTEWSAPFWDLIDGPFDPRRRAILQREDRQVTQATPRVIPLPNIG